MLKRANRLKARYAFKKTLSAQRICANSCFVAYGLPETVETANSLPKIGFVVSKKVHKRATRRNRIKRRLRELVRTWLLVEQDTSVNRFRSIVFIARSGSLEASYSELQQKMQQCFSQR